MTYKVILTDKFIKECSKSGLFKKGKLHPKIQTAIDLWKSGQDLPSGFRDHSLHKDKYNKTEYLKEIDGVRGDLREFHVSGNYVVVYKKYDGSVHLIELLHGGKHKDVLHTSIQI